MDKKLTAPGAKAPDKKRLQKRGKVAGGSHFVEVDLRNRGFDPAALFASDSDSIGSYVYHPEIVKPSRSERDPYRVVRRSRQQPNLGRRLGRLGASAVMLPVAALGGLVGGTRAVATKLRGQRMPSWLMPAGATLAVAGVSAWLMLGVTPASEPVLEQILAQNGAEKAQQVARLAADDGFFSGTRTRIVQYTTQAGDTVARLAARYGLNEQTIRSANALGSRDLKAGQTLAILPVNGVLHPIAKGETSLELAYRYGVPLAKIKDVNTTINLDRLDVGQKLVIPGVSAIKERPAPRVRQTPTRVANAGTSGRAASRGRQQPASRSLSTGGRFVQPTAGYLSSNYGWRWGSFHSGLDIAADPGTAIRAARDGVVVSAGWDGAYGQSIVISHGGGLTTRYAHCSRMHVAPGQRVSAGETIAAVGATGRATGPHVHFEVMVNGSHVNPAHYL